MELTRTHGIDIDSWYRHGPMALTWTLGMDMDSWYRHGRMVLTKTHGIKIDSWYLQHPWYPYAGFFLFQNLHMLNLFPISNFLPERHIKEN